MAKVSAAPRRSIREAQKELTRETLLEAARGAFEENGYVNVTVDEIVQRAGAGRGTFYLYVDRKAAVFQTVLEKRGLREQYQTLLARLAGIESPTVDALQAWFEEYVDLYRDNRAFLRAIHEARAVDPKFIDFVLQNMTEDVGRWPLPGFPPDVDSERLRMAALMGYVLAEGVMYLWLVQGLELNRALTTRILAEQFYASLQGAEGPSARATTRGANDRQGSSP